MGVYDRHAESIMVLLRKLVKRHGMVTVGVQAATAPVQTITREFLEEPDIREGRGPLLPQNRW
jgi:ribulose-5-phosphate 4-epimerase/fuculose-1-phosphate aldolase